jgi:PAS domain S-box-containing protein
MSHRKLIQPQKQFFSDEMLRFFDNATLGVVCLSSDGKITSSNVTAEHILGLSLQELKGKKITDPIWKTTRENKTPLSEEDHPAVLALKTGNIISNFVIGIYSPPQKAVLWAKVTAVPEFLPNHDKPDGVSVIFVDITEYQIYSPKDKFLDTINHELRTPLTGILGLSEALQMGIHEKLTSKQSRYIRLIEESGRRLLELINDLLDFSKTENDKLELYIQRSNLSDLCQGSLKFVKEMANQKKQYILFSIEPDPIIIDVDARRIKQMLINLLHNSIKFTPENGNLGLEVKGNVEEKTIRFTVWDNGIGIANEDIKKLFAPFAQVNRKLTRHYSGIGMGLSLVQKIAELHGGSVEVESILNKGSKFTVLLPWVNEISVINQTTNKKEIINSSTLVNGSEFNAEQTQLYLDEIGVNTVLHPSVRGALTRAVKLRPSVILLDIEVLNNHTVDLLANLKINEHTCNIPVIVISTKEQNDVFNLGATGFLVKPYSKNDLKAELAKVFESFQSIDLAMIISSPRFAPLVLIADSDEIVLETTSNFLITKGYRTINVRNGDEVLEYSPILRPNIILMDIQLPDMDGLETINRLRTHSDQIVASTPIIAIATLLIQGDREKCLQAGANDYMSKPISFSQLLKEITNLLNEKKNA